MFVTSVDWNPTSRTSSRYPKLSSGNSKKCLKVRKLHTDSEYTHFIQTEYALFVLARTLVKCKCCTSIYVKLMLVDCYSCLKSLLLASAPGSQRFSESRQLLTTDKDFIDRQVYGLATATSTNLTAQGNSLQSTNQQREYQLLNKTSAENAWFSHCHSLSSSSLHEPGTLISTSTADQKRESAGPTHERKTVGRVPRSQRHITKTASSAGTAAAAANSSARKCWWYRQTRKAAAKCIQTQSMWVILSYTCNQRRQCKRSWCPTLISSQVAAL